MQGTELPNGILAAAERFRAEVEACAEAWRSEQLPGARLHIRISLEPVLYYEGKEV